MEKQAKIHRRCLGCRNAPYPCAILGSIVQTPNSALSLSPAVGGRRGKRAQANGESGFETLNMFFFFRNGRLPSGIFPFRFGAGGGPGLVLM